MSAQFWEHMVTCRAPIRTSQHVFSDHQVKSSLWVSEWTSSLLNMLSHPGHHRHRGVLLPPEEEKELVHGISWVPVLDGNACHQANWQIGYAHFIELKCCLCFCITITWRAADGANQDEYGACIYLAVFIGHNLYDCNFDKCFKFDIN